MTRSRCPSSWISVPASASVTAGSSRRTADPPMPITPPTREELYQRYRRAMEALGFTHWSEGSRIGAIGEVQASYLFDLWLALADVEHQMNPATASGVYLER